MWTADSQTGVAGSGLEPIVRFARTEVGRYLAAHPEDRYPELLVRQLARLGAFAATVPAEHGGAGWSRGEVARLGYELGRAWQPLAGLVGTHLKLCRLVLAHGTPEQRRGWLAPMAAWRAGVRPGVPRAGGHPSRAAAYPGRAARRRRRRRAGRPQELGHQRPAR